VPPHHLHRQFRRPNDCRPRTRHVGDKAKPSVLWPGGFAVLRTSGVIIPSVPLTPLPTRAAEAAVGWHGLKMSQKRPLAGRNAVAGIGYAFHVLNDASSSGIPWPQPAAHAGAISFDPNQCAACLAAISLAIALGGNHETRSSNTSRHLLVRLVCVRLWP
jgi:hypothetical protein